MYILKCFIAQLSIWDLLVLLPVVAESDLGKLCGKEGSTTAPGAIDTAGHVFSPPVSHQLILKFKNRVEELKN